MTDNYPLNNPLDELEFDDDTDVVVNNAPADQNKNRTWLWIGGVVLVVALVLSCGWIFSRINANAFSDKMAPIQDIVVGNVEIPQIEGDQPNTQDEPQTVVETVVVTEIVEVPVEVVLTPAPEELEALQTDAYNAGVADGAGMTEEQKYGFTLLSQDGVQIFDGNLSSIFKVEQGIEFEGQEGTVTILIKKFFAFFNILRLVCDDLCTSLVFRNGDTGVETDLTPYLNMQEYGPGCPGHDVNLAVERGVNCEVGEILRQTGNGIFLGEVPANSLLIIHFSDDVQLGVNNGVFAVFTDYTLNGDLNMDGTQVENPTTVVPSE